MDLGNRGTGELGTWGTGDLGNRGTPHLSSRRFGGLANCLPFLPKGTVMHRTAIFLLHLLRVKLCVSQQFWR